MKKDSPVSSPKIGLQQILAYGMGDIYGGGAFLIIGMLFLFFLTEVIGLPAWSAALTFGIGKVWDAVSDPLMGRISDRTRTGMGRRRPWILIGVLPVFISFVLLWMSLPNAGVLLQVLYYSLTYILFSTAFTMVMVPYSALNADMTRDFKDRSRLSGARMAFSMISALLAGTIPKMIIDSRGGGSDGYRIMGFVFAGFYALALLPVFFGTREMAVNEEDFDDGGLKESVIQFFSLLRNRSFRLHMGLYLSAYTAMDVLMILFAYFLVYGLNRPGFYAPAMGTMMGFEILFLILWVRVANRRGKGFAFAYGTGLWAFGMIATLFLNSSSSTAEILIVCGLIGMGLSAAVFVPWAVLPSVTDVGELIDGKRNAGLYAGAMTLVRKLTQGAIAVPLVGMFLSFFGFGDGRAASEANIEGLRIFLVAGTLPFLVTGIYCALRFPVTPLTHAVMETELVRRRQKSEKIDSEILETVEIDRDTIAVCEKLSGIPWEQLGTDSPGEP